MALQATVLAFTALCFNYMRPGRKPTYLLDFYCLRPPNRCLIWLLTLSLFCSDP